MQYLRNVFDRIRQNLDLPDALKSFFTESDSPWYQLNSTESASIARSFLLNYLPLLLIILFFWPVFVTLILTLASASSWLFWILTSIIFGIVQLVYVVCQFVMISLDILMLSILKTFAMLRSQLRYYTIKSGLSKKHGKKRIAYISRRGRRKEWQRKLSTTKNFKEYLQIKIEEPPPKVKQLQEKNSQRPWWEGFMKRSRGDKNTSEDGTTCKARRGNRRNSPSSPFPESTGRSSPSRPPVSQGSDSHRKKRKSIGNTPATTKQSHSIPRAQSCANFDKGAEREESQKSKKGNGFPRPTSYGNISQKLFSSDNGGKNRLNSDPYGCVEEELGMIGGMLITTTSRLKEARQQASVFSTRVRSDGEGSETENNNDDDQDNEALSSLKFLLSGVVKRSHLSVDDVLIDNARSVAECGQYRLTAPSREVIKGYNLEVERCLEWIAESPVSTSLSTLSQRASNHINIDGEVKSPGSASEKKQHSRGHSASDIQEAIHRQNMEISDRINLIRKLKQNMGRTALMLSGGGAQAMYHLGTIRALIEGKVYNDIKVISGTSGGSITAAMCAIKTSEELHRDVCVPNVSTDFLLNGEMKKKGVRWFPKLVDMGAYWLKHRLLVDSKEFKRCCEFYFGDITFEEAFERTGKHVCITVTASRAEAGSSGRGAQRLLLSHISTPHVTLSSAVAASCALPGVMAPAKLVTKNASGKQEPFEVDGVEWIDGSVQADLPFRRISTLFNVSNYIVCQTNFHILPFLNKEHHPSQTSLYWKFFQTCEWDIRNRALNLSRLGLFPKLFGQDVSKVFSQKYHGNLTLVPRFTTMQTFGLKALVNPTVKDMEIYLKNGQIAAWPYISVIKEMIRQECAVDRCISRLEERYRNTSPDHDWQNLSDDVESIISASAAHGSATHHRVHILSSSREAELLRQKVDSLSTERNELRRQVDQLQRALGFTHCNNKLDEERLCLKSEKSKSETSAEGGELDLSVSEVPIKSGSSSNEVGSWTKVRRRGGRSSTPAILIEFVQK